ncbi:MAG TPA: hypothetical protein VE131_16330, partial [Terriglobales bacterium]|nr:hypothetical protein [Terriglobales bacterium]
MDSIDLARSLLDETKGIPDLAGVARAYVQKGRRILLERHRAGAGGMEVVSAYSIMMDHLIRYLFTAVKEDFIRRYPSDQRRCTLIAQGGYGRGELNPCSDIDLLFLYSWKILPYVEAVTEKLLYTLWDAGLQVGHAIRSVGESMRLAGADMKVRTALLDARYLCGDYSLYGEFDKAVETRLVKRRVGTFIQEKLAESRARHESYGGSVYLLEPEVKQGEGGLRDIHTARWIAHAKLNAKDLDALVVNCVVSSADIAELKAAQDFLLRVRNELHFSTGKHQDQLTFEEQEKVSGALGYQGEGSLKAVEVFMRAYYLHASQISRLTDLIIHRLTESGWPLFGGKYTFGRTLRDGVRMAQGQIMITQPSILRSDPGNLIRIFADKQKNGCQLAHETREL